MIRVTHRSCHSKEMTPLPILFAAVYFSALGTLLPKSFTGTFSSNSPLDVIEVLRHRFTVQRMLIYQNAVFLPEHAVSSMQAI